jgi:hypothetical protein
MSESNPRIPFKLAGSRSAYAPPAAGRLTVHVVVNISSSVPADKCLEMETALG